MKRERVLSIFWDDLQEEVTRRDDTLKTVQISQHSQLLELPQEVVDVPLNAEDAKQHLSYAYDSHAGGSQCYPIYAWGEHFLYFVVVYDGATWIDSIALDPANSRAAHLMGGE